MDTSAAILCTTCLKDNIREDAVKYCVDCNENMCKPCLRLHIKTRATSTHQLIGRDVVPDWLRVEHGTCEVMCTRHPCNVLVKFCEDHSLLCCVECEELEHSSCEHVLTISDAAQRCEASAEQTALNQDLQRLSSELSYELGKRRELQVHVRKSTAESLAAVREIRRQANKLFEELEKKTIEETNTNCIDKDNVLESDISQINAMTTVLNVSVKQVEASSDSSLQTLLRFQHSKRLQNDGKQLLNNIKSSDTDSLKEFAINPNIAPFLDRLQSIGGFVSKGNTFMELRSHKEVNIRHTSDEVECDIQGVTFIKDGRIILCDFENAKLKCLSGSLELSDDTWLQMCGEPFAVCYTGEQEIAVTLPGVKLVQFLSLKPDFVLESVIHVEEYCRGLGYSYLYDELYVACGGGSQPGEGLGQIRVYNKTGTLLRTLKVDKSGKPLLSQPRHLSVSNDGSTLHVADSIKGLITLNRHGMVLSTFTTAELEDVHGVCVDVNDNVIVCGHKSNNVIQIQRQGREYRVLAGDQEGVRCPTLVSYDTRTSSLLVTSGSCDILHVFHAK